MTLFTVISIHQLINYQFLFVTDSTPCLCRDSEEVNVFEAGASGAAVAAKTVSVVVAGYIAFMSILAFVNATLSWLGGRVGYSELSFEVSTCS